MSSTFIRSSVNTPLPAFSVDSFALLGLSLIHISELTGITNEMVADAPSEKDALEAFLAFAGDRILVGHNVHAFDMRFLRAAAQRSGIKLEPTYIDTLTMAQTMRCV